MFIKQTLLVLRYLFKQLTLIIVKAIGKKNATLKKVALMMVSIKGGNRLG